MKTIVLAIVLLPITIAFSQTSDSIVTTVFYFGGSDCGYCVMERNVQNIKTMKEQLPSIYPARKFKFVLVVMDEDIQRGIKYSSKYPGWNELSIGMFYHNELMLAHVNKTKLPGVPHIMIYEDSFAIGDYNVPTISKRKSIVELVGANAIDEWIKDGYKLAK
jgi:hypothetical protein